MQLQLNPPSDNLDRNLKNDFFPVLNPVCHLTYNRDAWVKLIQLPSFMSFDEARLLCHESDEVWVAWVPDHGEVRLHRSEFYC